MKRPPEQPDLFPGVYETLTASGTALTELLARLKAQGRRVVSLTWTAVGVAELEVEMVGH